MVPKTQKPSTNGVSGSLLANSEKKWEKYIETGHVNTYIFIGSIN